MQKLQNFTTKFKFVLKIKIFTKNSNLCKIFIFLFKFQICTKNPKFGEKNKFVLFKKSKKFELNIKIFNKI